MLRWRLPLAGVAALLALVVLNHHAHAAALHRAALVIEHGSGRLITRCVTFVEDQISGLQLIQRSGVDYQAQQFGALGSAICQLDGEPSPVPSSCFGSGSSWEYFHRTPAGWAPSGAGASASALRDGDMDGWHYAAGANQPPAGVSFTAVCAPPASPAATTAQAFSAPQAGKGMASVARPSSASQSTPTPPVAPTSSPSLLALAPSTTPKAELPLTTAAKPRTAQAPERSWLLVGGGATLLLALLLFNLRRGGP